MKELIVKNPVLKEFNPDPSMIYVNDTFYIAIRRILSVSFIRNCEKTE